MNFILGEISKNDSFAGKLFSIALENGSIVPHYSLEKYRNATAESAKVINSDYLNGIGVTYNVMDSVLRGYINQNTLINDKVCIKTSKINGKIGNYNVEKKRLRNEIIDLVEDGKPVLMGGSGYYDLNNNGIKDENEKGYGHVVVAYDYDDENDILYGNMGWGSSYTHYDLDNYFNLQLSDYWTLEIYKELPQTYTNNYYFLDANATYCPYKNSVYNTINPSEYGFTKTYSSTELISEIYMPSSNNETLVSFNRYRCGYIEEEAINLSPRKAGFSEAYLEYTFEKNVDRIIVDLSFWSSKEFTNKYNSKYQIEYLLNDEWISILDLWNDIEIPMNRIKPLTIEIDFPSNIRSFRFYSWSQYTSDRNKGRLSIFDMMIVYE